MLVAGCQALEECLLASRPEGFPRDITDLYKRDVDRTLLREALKLTPTERLQRLIELSRFTEQLRHAPKKTSA